MKFNIEIEDKLAMMICLLGGAAIGAIIVVALHNDMLIERGYDKYRKQYPSSVITLEEYKRLAH
jgi:hypothetical protein